MNRNDSFIALYNRLDQGIRDKYGLENASFSAINYYITKLRKSGGRKAYEASEQLDALRELRNSLVHMVRIKDEEPFEVSEAALTALQNVYDYLSDPPLLIEKAISAKKLLVCDYETKVLSLSKEMVKRGIGHIPLMDHDRCAGIYSESCLFHFLTDHPEAPLGELKILDLGDYLFDDAKRNERYLFVAKDYLLEDAVHEALVSKSETGKRMGLFLITETGKREEPLLAAVSAGGLV